MNTIRIAAMSLGLIALVGCKKAPEQPLSSVKVPAGYTFATSQGVDINLTAAASALPTGGKGEIDIARADGKTIYRGEINSTTPLHVKLSVPLKDAELIATIDGPNGTKSAIKVPIANAAAQYAFR